MVQGAGPAARAVAAVQHLNFESDTHPGDCCVKSGFVKGGNHFVVKIASGAEHGLGPSSNGAMIVFSQRNGYRDPPSEAPVADYGYPCSMTMAAAAGHWWTWHGRPVAEGHLTDLRTALAACVGVCGTGIIGKLALWGRPRPLLALWGAGTRVRQARAAAHHLRAVSPCRRVCAWARSPESGKAYATHAEARGGSGARCAAAVQPGTCIQELDPALVAAAGGS
eukprot:gene25551-32837_t